MSELPPPNPEQVDAAARIVGVSKVIAVLTGAGISTDSGIPDFRGPNGVWTKNPEAEKKAHIHTYISDSAHRQANWKRLAEGSIWQDKVPNVGHRSLAELEASGKLHTLVTQNVDGLHQAAGSSDAVMVEIHGTARRVKCLDCGDEAPMQKALDRVVAGEADPPCRSCGGILKSATVSFGQSLVTDDLERAEIAARSCDLLMCVGSSLAVYPIAGMVPIAHQNGARLIIINGEPTQFDPIADVVLNTSISAVLPTIVAAANRPGL